MYVREHMTAPAVTVSTASSAAEAKRILERRKFRHLPVIDDEGRLAGIVSDRDVRSLWPSGLGGADEKAQVLARLEQTPLRECMTRNPRVLALDSTLDDALHVLENMRIGALPVLDGERRVAGMFAVPDLMRAYRVLFGIGEEGTAFLEVRDDGTAGLPGRIFAVLEKTGVPLLRYVRRAGGDGEENAVFLRVATYNIHGLKEELRKERIDCP